MLRLLLLAFLLQTFTHAGEPILRFPPEAPQLTNVVWESPEALLRVWKDKLPKIGIGRIQCWVVEGDIPMDATELGNHALEYSRLISVQNGNNLARLFVGTAGLQREHVEMSVKEPPRPVLPPGVVPAINNHGSKWPPDKVLSYAVCRPSFASDKNYNDLVQSFELACHDWEKICHVKLQHLVTNDIQDSGTLLGQTNSGIDFAVEYSTNDTGFEAISFFPFDTRERRRAVFTPRFFLWVATEMRNGICRHEIGHVLGFAHEHDNLAAPPDCIRDADPHIYTVNSFYDANSVMHYHCGDNQNTLYDFTPQDRKVAIQVYGIPY